MERFKERDLPLRGVLRMQAKEPDVLSYIATCQPYWEKAVAEGKLRNGTVFALQDQIFVYYESTVPFHLEEYLPEIDKYVYLWPGQEKLRPYVTMVKAYQSLPMEEVRDWKRLDGTRPSLMISRMKLDLLQSYIYYHYLMQEELPGYSGRYLGIWFNEDWCVLYNQQEPDTPIDTNYTGKLATKTCPVDQWTEHMVPHFYQWPDGQLYQRGEIILHVQE